MSQKYPILGKLRGVLIITVSLFLLTDSVDAKRVSPRKKVRKTTINRKAKQSVRSKRTKRRIANKKPAKKPSALGEQVVMRIDRLIKKKSFELMGDPWTIQGIPIFFPSPYNGIHLGVHISLFNIRRQDPHKLQISGQVLASTEGRMKHFLFFDSPHALGGEFRIRAQVNLDRDIDRNYFGISNDTVVDETQINNRSGIYGNTRQTPRLAVEVLKRFGRYTFFGPVFGIRSTSIGFPPGSLLDTERPLGVTGGETNYVGLAFIEDRTDFEPYPSRGIAHEVYGTLYNGIFGSDYNFFRGTYTFRKYWPLHRRLTLAHRSFLEVLVGDIPFFELGAVGGRFPRLGFGGKRHLRGYYEGQFIGDVKFATGLELRWDPLTFYIKRQRITVGLVPFLDIGRVWNKGRPFRFDSFHGAVGLGIRSIWNYRLVLRGDFSMSENGAQFIVEMGNAF